MVEISPFLFSPGTSTRARARFRRPTATISYSRQRLILARRQMVVVIPTRIDCCRVVKPLEDGSCSLELVIVNAKSLPRSLPSLCIDQMEHVYYSDMQKLSDRAVPASACLIIRTLGYSLARSLARRVLSANGGDINGRGSCADVDYLICREHEPSVNGENRDR